jgi:hypothetical protein
MLRLRITTPPKGTADGVRLDLFQVGCVYDVGTQIGALLLSERWAEPVHDTYPALVLPMDQLRPVRSDGRKTTSFSRFQVGKQYEVGPRLAELLIVRIRGARNPER